ncbi:hypothetical protein ACS0TY_005807 [Phlomoides rotata]
MASPILVGSLATASNANGLSFSVLVGPRCRYLVHLWVLVLGLTACEMSKGKQVADLDLADEEVLRVDLDLEEKSEVSSWCLVGKVLTNKPLNAFGFLESMKRAMAPTGGFAAREIDKNLFSFQFNSEMDLRAVLEREPWHFDKNVLVLKEFGRGQQPADVNFNSAAFWVRIYELPMAARNQQILTLITGKIGELVELDTRSMEGFGQSIRAKIRIYL